MGIQDLPFYFTPLGKLALFWMLNLLDVGIIKKKWTTNQLTNKFGIAFLLCIENSAVSLLVKSLQRFSSAPGLCSYQNKYGKELLADKVMLR